MCLRAERIETKFSQCLDMSRQGTEPEIVLP
jgi:hypothetical protein